MLHHIICHYKALINQSIIVFWVRVHIIYFIHLLLNQYCLLDCLCCKLDCLVHLCTLHYAVCLTKTKSTMTCLFWGDTFPITAHSASFLAITWYFFFSGGWGVIRALGGVCGRESGLEFQVPLASECLCWPIARTLTVVTCLISRAGRRGVGWGGWSNTHNPSGVLLVCVNMRIKEMVC